MASVIPLPGINTESVRGLDERSDDELMQLAAGDVMPAFTALVRRHEGAVRRYAGKFCGSAATGDDVAQETFVELWGARRRYRPVGKFRVFLFTIVRNRCRNQHRGRQRQAELRTDLVEVLPAPTANQLDEVLTAERQRQVDEEIATLSPKLREAVLLRFAEGLEYGEIRKHRRMFRGDAAIAGVSRCGADSGWVQRGEAMSDECLGSERLARHADGELTVNEAAVVTKHLTGCATCRKELALVRELMGQIATRTPTRAQGRNEDRFVSGVLARIEAQRQADQPRLWTFRWRLPAWTWGMALAAATAVVLLPRFTGNQPGREMEVAEFASRGGGTPQASLAKRVGAEIQNPSRWRARGG